MDGKFESALIAVVVLAIVGALTFGLQSCSQCDQAFRMTCITTGGTFIDGGRALCLRNGAQVQQ